MNNSGKNVDTSFGLKRDKSSHVFVAMSFSGNPILETYFNRAIRPVIKKYGLKPNRIDQQNFNGKISRQIELGIEESLFVIVDLTEDKPNCYFEAGYALALGKEVIFQRLNAPCYEPKFEFDVQDFNHILYTTDQDLKKQLNDRIQGILNSSE